MKNKLLEIRLSKGYKYQKDFAEFLGVNQYQYSRYETNDRQPSLEVLLKICHKLDMDIREIYS